MVNKMALLVGFLTLVILILVTVVVFSFWVKPAFNGYVVKKQVEAQNLILSNIVLQVQQNGIVQIPVGNQTLLLAPFNPQQAQQVQPHHHR